MRLETLDTRRAAAALAVVLLHVIVLMMLLHAHFAPPEQNQPVREILLRFFRPPPPVPERHAQPPPPQLAAPRPYVSAPTAITPPPPALKPGTLQGLHLNLFNCAPENLGNLPPEDRAQCGSLALAPAPDETKGLLNAPSRTRDERHWQRALARKQNPLLLPCASPAGIAITPLLILCLAKGAAHGFGDLDEAPGYGDMAPATAHVPNNGDPQIPPPHN